MLYVESLLLVVGIALLVLGYRRNNRNTLLVAALLLFAVGIADGVVQGLVDSIRGWAA